MTLQRMTVLGASGYVGSALGRHLAGLGHPVFTPERNSPHIYTEALGTVVYCNGMTANFMADPLATLHAHVNYLASVLRNANFDRIVYLSSCRLYDQRVGQRCFEAEPLALSPAHPRHLYDLSKALGENLCLTASGGRGSVARLACVYDDSPEAGGFLPALLRRLPSEHHIALDSDPASARDYVHLDTVLQALRGLATMDSAGHIANIASGENCSNQQLVDSLCEHGWGVRFVERVGQSSPPPAPVCDTTFLQTTLAIQPIMLGEWLDTHLRQIRIASRQAT